MRPLYITFIALLNCAILPAQTLSVDEFFERTSQQCMIYPSEKVYLHTDRSSFVAGDTVWMRAYVVHGIAHTPMRQSAYVYVELQNPFMETVSRVRLKADKDGFIHGNIPLPEDLPKGEYSLYAYTQYMMNFGEEYFFKTLIQVNSVLNNSIRMETSRIGRSLKVHFTNPTTGEVKEVRNLAVKGTSGEISAQYQDMGYSIKIHNSDERVILVQAGNYKEFIRLDMKPDYDVSFLPEGGNMVPGTFNRIAFKSINTLGQGEDISGHLMDENDSILLSFKSLYRGMGSFTFIPQKGMEYTAVCEDKNGVQKRFTLPEATDRYSLQVTSFRKKFYVKVPFSPYEKNHEKLIVFAHQRGWPVKLGKWSKTTPGLVCSEDDFIEGVASFLLVNESGQIVSERMVFIRKEDVLSGNMLIDNHHPGEREKISLQLQVSEKWWKGDCSVSVTNNKDMLPDSCNNILSSLLLSSDLRGYIEAPAWYFEKDSQDTLDIRTRALDALMMTQGWKKYDFNKVWKKEYQEPVLLPERSQQITGKVTTKVGHKPVGKGRVQLMVPKLGVKEEVRTKEDGTFIFDNFDAPDSTVYWVSAFTEKGKGNIVLELDTVVYPALKSIFPPLRKVNNHVPFDYLAKADMKLLYDKGIRHLFLDEVLVTAPHKEPKTQFENVHMNKSIIEEDISQSGAIDMSTLMQQKITSLQMGILIDDEGNNIAVIKMRNEPILVVLDDVTLNPLVVNNDENLAALQVIRSLNPQDISQIDVIKGAFAVCIHSKATGGLIAITTKTGGKEYNAKWHPTNLKTIMPLGFQQPAEFYTPKYELQADRNKKEPDLRTTIHWQPRLEVKNGKANVEFYTADGIVDYTVVIEGVGEDGSLLRVEEKIK